MSSVIHTYNKGELQSKVCHLGELKWHLILNKRVSCKLVENPEKGRNLL